VPERVAGACVTDGSETTVPETLLLEECIPAWDHEMSMSQVFRAAPAEVLDAITNLDLFRLPVTRVLLEARGMPGRLPASTPAAAAM
jgi:hypothetical protein